MKKATLIRYYQDDQCTLGLLKIVGHKDPVFYTIERPWLNNEKNVSCFPEGTYTCFIRQSPSNGEVYELRDVPNRTHCQIHAGNFVHSVIGCVAIGEGAGYINNQKAVISSVSALNRFKEIMNYEDFELTVIGGSL